MVTVRADVFLPELLVKVSDSMAGKPASLAGYRQILLADALMEAKRKRDYNSLFVDGEKFTRLSDEAFGTDYAAGKCWLWDSPDTMDAVNLAVLEATVSSVEISGISESSHADLFLQLDTTEEELIARAKDILAEKESIDKDLAELEEERA